MSLNRETCDPPLVRSQGRSLAARLLHHSTPSLFSLPCNFAAPAAAWEQCQAFCCPVTLSLRADAEPRISIAAG
jgi:hypothetical protein